MPALDQWKQRIAERIPQWDYTPSTEKEAEGSNASDGFSLRDCLSSKVLWRVMLVIATILLLLNLLFPAQDVLRRYGLTGAGSPGAEVLYDPLPTEGVDWSQFAYCQYVTSEDYLCNSLMIFEALSRVNAKADRIMLHPHDWDIEKKNPRGRLLRKARDTYGVHMVPIEVQSLGGDSTWSESFTKLLAFNQTQYKRVLSLDSDSTVLQPMDELFLLPDAPVAMPRAYWLDQFYLSSQLVLVEPSAFEFDRISKAFQTRDPSDFDMEIVNDLYGESCFIIPHRRYDLLTGEFRNGDHTKYLGSPEEQWDPDKILEETKFLHFSDWPFPKPWIKATDSQRRQMRPKCHESEDGQQDCRNQQKWLSFYEDFSKRRAEICGAEFVHRRKRDLSAEHAPSKLDSIV